MNTELITYENLIKSNYVGKDALFIESFVENKISIYQKRENNGDEWSEYFRRISEVTIPDTDYKIKLIEWSNWMMTFLKTKKNEMFFVIDCDFDKYFTYKIVINSKTREIVAGFRGYDSLKVPLEEHYKYWGSQ